MDQRHQKILIHHRILMAARPEIMATQSVVRLVLLLLVESVNVFVSKYVK
jgi:hypothetical protein